MSDIPVLPYGGANDPNSGFSGSETSEARAREADRKGVTGYRQRRVLTFVHQHGTHGATWREVSEALGMHHGSASAALSNLHRGDHLARLGISRQRSRVYVHPDFVGERTTEPAGQNSTTAMLDQMADLLDQRPLCTHGPLPEVGCWSCRCRQIVRRYDARNPSPPKERRS
jgi:hypothetical protein